MKKIFYLFVIGMLLFITGCGTVKEENNQNNNSNANTNTNASKDNDYIIDDDEIIDFDDLDNEPDILKDVESTLINCNDCVFTFFKDKKEFGSVISNYTNDYSLLRDERGYQRRRFLGLVLDGSGNIQKAYACGIEKGKAYCLQGTPDGSAFEYNVGILNQVFAPGECSYNANSTRYTCIGETNGDTRKDGYVSVHYDENCHIFGDTFDHSAQIYCY